MSAGTTFPTSFGYADSRATFSNSATPSGETFTV